MEPRAARVNVWSNPARVAWCIFALLAVAVGSALWRWPESESVMSSTEAEFVRYPATPPVDLQDFNVDLDGLPLDERIQRASVVLITGIDREGETHKAVIREIYVIKAGTQFHYRVGDEYERLSHFPRDECQGCEGDGQIVFLVGNPARMRVSYSFEGDRIESFGDLRLDDFRLKVQELSQAAALDD
jgi:hypothetical protein